MNILKLKYVLVVLLIGNTALASGWGDPGPTEKYHTTYTCASASSPVKVVMESIGYEIIVIPLTSVAIQGLENNIAFETNTVMDTKVSEYHRQYASQAPDRISNARFLVRSQAVEGFGIYRDSNYQIGLFSSYNGQSSSYLDVFIFNLKKNTQEPSLRLPCELIVRRILGK